MDIEELKRLAKEAIRGMNAKKPEFIAAASPAAVLELIAEVERLRAELALREAAVEHSHVCRRCRYAYTPSDGESEDCPKCGHDGKGE